MRQINQSTINDHINALAAHNKGCITPAEVLDDAKNIDSPLHNCFDWDDTEAAIKYRLIQARKLIRSVKVHFTVEQIDYDVAAYIHKPVDRNPPMSRKYIQTDVAARNPEMSLDILIDELGRLKPMLMRTKNLALRFGFDPCIDDIINALINAEHTVRRGIESDEAA